MGISTHKRNRCTPYTCRLSILNQKIKVRNVLKSEKSEKSQIGNIQVVVHADTLDSKSETALVLSI